MLKALSFTLLFGILSASAQALPTLSCEHLFDSGNSGTALALVNNQEHIHRLISRSGLTRAQALPLIKELISSGVLGGKYHEMAYIMITRPKPAGYRTERAHTLSIQDFEARSWSRKDLKKFSEEISKSPGAARAMGEAMYELIIELVGKASKPPHPISDELTSYGFENSGWENRLELYIGEENRKNLEKLIPLLESPQAKKLLREFYENSVPDIARYTYSRSGGVLAKLAHGAIITPVALGTLSIALGSAGGLIYGFFDGSWTIGLSSFATFLAINPVVVHGDKISEGVNKLVNVPRLWLSARHRNRLEQAVLAAPGEETFSDKMKELIEPYQPFQTELYYQRSRNLQHDFSSDETITASSLADIKSAADSQIFVAGVAVNQLRRESAYAERLLELSAEFIETGFLAGSEVTPHAVDVRWSQARAIRTKIEKMQDDAEIILMELQERFATVQRLRKKLENAKSKFDEQKVAEEIESLKKAEDEIRFYVDRFKKQRMEELNPALGRLEDTLRDGLMPIRIQK